MGINYPNGANNGVDVFTEPSLPETTPLAEAGTGTRNHVEHHRDLGAAVVALELNAAFKNHDHSGAGGTAHGNKLAQANTHESPDTDSSASSLHHTLGTSATQAAAGNHTHDYNGSSILNRPFFLCTSTTRPSSPANGTMIYETDTNCVRAWASFPTPSGSPSWQLLPVAAIPYCRLRQNAAQPLSTPAGTALIWGEELEDNFNFFSGGTDVIIKEAGLYHVETALQWDAAWAPDQGTVTIFKGSGDTPSGIQQSDYLRGGLNFTPGFSQTISCSGKLRFTANEVLRVKASYAAPNTLIDKIVSYFDGASQVKSRLDITFIGP